MLGVGLVFGCWFGVLGLGFGVWGIGCWVLGFGLGAWMSGLRGYGVLRRSHMAVHIHMQALSVPPLRLCYAFNPLGLDGGFLKRGEGDRKGKQWNLGYAKQGDIITNPSPNS